MSFSEKSHYGLLFCAVLTATISLTSSVVFFKHIKLFGYEINASSLVFPLMYIFLDYTSSIVNNYRKSIVMTLFVVFIPNLVSSIFLYLIMQIPSYSGSVIQSSYNDAFSVIGPQMFVLNSGALLGSTIASIAEVIIFLFIYNRIKVIGVCIIISSSISLATHNFITDLHQGQPLNVVINLTTVSIVFIAIYTIILQTILKIVSWKKQDNN